jgi:CheY-like chemotaxis protein
MLDVSAVVRGKLVVRKKPVTVRAVVDNAVEIASELVRERGHSLEVSVPDALVVDGDLSRLTQVVANLLTNSARYTPPGGHLSVKAGRVGKDVVLSVRDDGIGIAPEMLPRVFEMFVQAPQPADRPTGGLGLGLTLVRRIVELHGGQVTLESLGLGKGTVATVVLPAHTARPEQALPAQRPGVARKSVLFVDDNTDHAELLADLLSAHGHSTAVAHDGPSALERLRREPCDVAVVDIGLPGMNGLELARAVREELGERAPRLIALTGYGTAADRARCLEAGFAEHLTKPVNTERLLGLLDV